jgi:hypothetical protein
LLLPHRWRQQGARPTYRQRLGVIIAWIALLIVAKVPIRRWALWPAIIGAAVFLLVIVASIERLSVVPANVYGYAAAAAYRSGGASPTSPPPT